MWKGRKMTYTNAQMIISPDGNSYTGAANFSSVSSNATSINVLPIYRFGDFDNNQSLCSEVGKYSVYKIADWFLSKANMTHKKLQKLCYYAQAWCYALHDFRLMDTDFQAWIHGPVSPALWEKFKSFGFSTISIDKSCKVIIIDEDIELLEDVWKTYGDMTGNALEVLSHREMPWIEARRGYAENEKCTVVISPDSMATFYRSIYKGE